MPAKLRPQDAGLTLVHMHKFYTVQDIVLEIWANLMYTVFKKFLTFA